MVLPDFLFHVFFPITYPLDSLRYRKAQCALVGNPPFFPPGRQLGDYLERTLVHSVRGFRRHVRKYSSTAWLPSELCHIIVDLCGDDIRTLKTLSVVSSLWTHRTRIYLFQYIRATRHEAYHLAKTLSSPCSTLNTIQRLHIVDEHYWYLIPSILDQLARANVLVEFLELSTHRLLKNVKFARIQRIRTRHLRMRCRPYHDELINDALRFACAFPGLESLSVTASHNFEIMSPPTSAYTLPQEVLRFPTNLRSLSIQMLSPLKLASWLMDNHWYAMEHLVSLELLSGAGKDDEYLFRYQRGFESQREDLEKFLRGLEMLGPQLQHFGITIGKHGDGLRRGFVDWFSRRKGPPLFPSLQSITFDQPTQWLLEEDTAIFVRRLCNDSGQLRNVIFRCYYEFTNLSFKSIASQMRELAFEEVEEEPGQERLWNRNSVAGSRCVRWFEWESRR